MIPGDLPSNLPPATADRMEWWRRGYEAGKEDARLLAGFAAEAAK